MVLQVAVGALPSLMGHDEGYHQQSDRATSNLEMDTHVLSWGLPVANSRNMDGNDPVQGSTPRWQLAKSAVSKNWQDDVAGEYVCQMVCTTPLPTSLGSRTSRDSGWKS